MKRETILLTIAIFFLASCGSKKYKEIPMENLDSGLREQGSLIVKDILASIHHEQGAHYLLDKDYMTPLVHGRIMHNREMYREAYKMVPMVIGKVVSYGLFQAVDRKVVTTLRYKLTSESDNFKLVELRIDINDSYGLADYYLFITTKDGAFKNQNILPRKK